MTFSKSAPRLLLIAGLALGGANAALAGGGASHTHLGHVVSGWADAPDGMGFLPAAIAEAEIAIFHAGLAAQKLDDLGWMQTHARHVLQAIDAGAIEGGPGLGFGVMAGAAGTVKHIGLAAGADDASEGVKIHAEHVSTSATNVLATIEAIKANIATILAATDAAGAAEATRANLALTADLLDGADADGDGQVDWTDGGLNEAKKHADIMAAGEGL